MRFMLKRLDHGSPDTGDITFFIACLNVSAPRPERTRRNAGFAMQPPKRAFTWRQAPPLHLRFAASAFASWNTGPQMG
jgi:hypothetical protein